MVEIRKVEVHGTPWLAFNYKGRQHKFQTLENLIKQGEKWNVKFTNLEAFRDKENGHIVG